MFLPPFPSPPLPSRSTCFLMSKFMIFLVCTPILFSPPGIYANIFPFPLLPKPCFPLSNNCIALHIPQISIQTPKLFSIPHILPSSVSLLLKASQQCLHSFPLPIFFIYLHSMEIPIHKLTFPSFFVHSPKYLHTHTTSFSRPACLPHSLPTDSHIKSIRLHYLTLTLSSRQLVIFHTFSLPQSFHLIQH